MLAGLGWGLPGLQQAALCPGAWRVLGAPRLPFHHGRAGLVAAEGASGSEVP